LDRHQYFHPYSPKHANKNTDQYLYFNGHGYGHLYGYLHQHFNLYTHEYGYSDLDRNLHKYGVRYDDRYPDIDGN